MLNHYIENMKVIGLRNLRISFYQMMIRRIRSIEYSRDQYRDSFTKINNWYSEIKKIVREVARLSSLLVPDIITIGYDRLPYQWKVEALEAPIYVSDFNTPLKHEALVKHHILVCDLLREEAVRDDIKRCVHLMLSTSKGEVGYYFSEEAMRLHRGIPKHHIENLIVEMSRKLYTEYYS